MIEESQTRLHEIFDHAAGLPPHDRDRYLDEACAGDAELRALVEQLLAWDAEAGGDFLEGGAVRPRPTQPDWVERPGTTVGPYTLDRKIGEGGMAIVWLATQTEPVHRTVAMKILKPGMDSRQVLARFEMERHVLALLNHPHVAHVLDAGMTERGRPYFVMEYVDGEMLTRYCDEHDLSNAQRLDLFAEVCDAVQHAHQKGVIHRDIKPSNIVVSTHDGQPLPKVIDFGIAKATAGDLTPGTVFTEHGQLMGTPEYMSPEQCEGTGDLDVRSDVYSLGVVLYEMLCGRLPYDLEGVPIYDIPRTIRDRTALRPATVDRALAGDLETIVLKALEKDREDRYQSAADLGRDIRRFLSCEPIEARPRSMIYHARLFSRRHRVIVGASAAVLLTLLAAVTVSVAFAVDASREATRRAEAEQEAIEERDAAMYRSYVASMAAAESAFVARHFARLQSHLDAAPLDYRGWEWHYLKTQAEGSEATIPHDAMVDGIAISPDGSIIASGARDGMIRLWDAHTRERLRTLRGHEGYIHSIAFAPDGRTLVSGGLDATVRLWSVDAAEPIRILTGHTGGVMQVLFRGDGRQVLSAGADGLVRLWDVEAGDEIWSVRHPAGVQGLALRSDGEAVATGDNAGTIRLLDAGSGDELDAFPAHTSEIRHLDFDPSGRRLVSSGRDHAVRVWDLRTHAAIWESPLGQWSAVFSPDGTKVAVGDMSPSFAINIFDADAGRLLGSLAGHADTAYTIAFAPDGMRLLTGSWDRTVRIWDIRPAIGDGTISVGSPVVSVATSPDDRLIAWATGDGTLAVRDATTLEAIDFGADDEPSRAVAFDATGRLLAVGRASGDIDVFDTATGAPLYKLEGHAAPVQALAFDPNGGRLVSGASDARAIVWDLDDRRIVHTLKGHRGWVISVAFSPFGRVATATTDVDGEANLWNADTGELVTRLRGHASRIYAVAFSPDGRRLATGSRDQTVRIWDGLSGDGQALLEGHGQFIASLAWMPDGSRLVGGSFFRALTIWDGETFENLMILRAHDEAIWTVATSPDSTRIVTGSLDGTARVWDRRSRDDRDAALARAARLHADARDRIASRLAAGAGRADLADEIERDPDLDPAMRRAMLNALLASTPRQEREPARPDA